MINKSEYNNILNGIYERASAQKQKEMKEKDCAKQLLNKYGEELSFLLINKTIEESKKPVLWIFKKYIRIWYWKGVKMELQTILANK